MDSEIQNPSRLFFFLYCSLLVGDILAYHRMIFSTGEE
jgi:hypothetical protein